MANLQLLAANPVEVLGIVAGIVVVLFHVLGAISSVAAKPQPPRRAIPQPPRPPQAPANPDSLQSEIEEFLRKASGRAPAGQQRPQQQQGQPPQRQPSQRTQARPPQVQPPRQQPNVVRPAGRPDSRPNSRRGQARPAVQQTRPIVAEVLPADDTPDALDRHVKEFLNTRGFERREAQLSSIDEREQKFDQQLKQTFTHEVGHLKGDALAMPGDAPVMSAEAPELLIMNAENPLISLLSSREALRRIIVLNEILARPEHRW